MTNLEPICAKYGHQMILPETIIKIKLQDQENIITKGLGVLMESGLYAMCIFFLSRSKKDHKKYGEKILTICLRGLWQDEKVNILSKEVSGNPENLLKEMRKITESLPKLNLTRKVTEQALIFARYHARAEITSTE